MEKKLTSRGSYWEIDMVEKFGKCTACGYIADDYQDAKTHSKVEHNGDQRPGFGGYDPYDPESQSTIRTEEESA